MLSYTLLRHYGQNLQYKSWIMRFNIFFRGVKRRFGKTSEQIQQEHIENL